MTKKRYAVVGTGGRSDMYISALAGGDYKEYAELVAFCDVNQGRMDYYNERIGKKFNHPAVPTYLSQDFDRMIAECKPDTVIVTTIDRAHHKYGCRAMELGCDVISEKPMTVDVEKCQQIIDTQKKTGKHYTVTFNYRYSPRNTKIKELLKSGICGEITSVNFEWLLDTSHGADYFRRWHRCKRNSGGLMVHKATHHFDLVNWWLDSVPVSVYAMGDLKFYGRENAEKRGVTEFYQRAKDSEIAKKDPFAFRLDKDFTEFLQRLYFDSEKYDGYQRDQSVFGDGIDIEDNMSVMVRYKNKAVMTYCLCAHCPWEGYRIVFNGTKGRLEFNVVERSFCEAGEDMSQFGMRELGQDRSELIPEIIFQPHWGKAQVIDYECESLAGHGGGDAKLLHNVFVGADEDPLGLAADYHDGAKSILTGIGANISMKTGLPVNVQELIHW